jgi:hypothetical protein
MEVLVDGQGKLLLHNGWRHFTHVHSIEVGHFVVFKYEGHDMVTVRFFDEIMCHCHYHADGDD